MRISDWSSDVCSSDLDGGRRHDRARPGVGRHRQPPAACRRGVAMDVLDGFDPVLEHRVRLAVGVLLAGHGEISFARLKQQLSLTDGNLGAQLRRLEDDGYIALRRASVERKRSEEQTYELQSLMRTSYSVSCFKH